MKVLLFLPIETYLTLVIMKIIIMVTTFIKLILEIKSTYTFRVLLDKMKSSFNSKDEFLVYKDETIEHLSILYELLVKQEINLKVVSKNPAVNCIFKLISNVKFLSRYKLYRKVRGSVQGLCFIIRKFIHVKERVTVA